MNPATVTNTRGHLSSQTIDLLLLGALPADAGNAAKAHLDDCERCRTQWRELNDDKDRFEKFVFARTLPKVEARAAQQMPFFTRLRLGLALPALALVASALVVGWVATGSGQTADDEPYVGLKGAAPALEVFAVRGAGGSFAVTSGAALQPSDRLRFVVSPGRARYLLIASKDGVGTFTVYHPFGATQSVELPADGLRRELDGAVELDAALGTERLVAVFSQEPVQAATVEAALEANPTDPKVPEATVVSLDFVKVRP